PAVDRQGDEVEAEDVVPVDHAGIAEDGEQVFRVGGDLRFAVVHHPADEAHEGTVVAALEDLLGAGGLDVEADYTGHLFPSPSGCSRGCREEVLVLPGVEQAVVPAAEMPGPMWPRQLRDAQMVTVFAVSRYRSGGENVLLQERFREQITHPFLPVDVRLKRSEK